MIRSSQMKFRQIPNCLAASVDAALQSEEVHPISAKKCLSTFDFGATIYDLRTLPDAIEATMQEQFKEVSLDIVPDIITALKNDPEALIHCQLLAMYQRCKATIQERVIKLYTPNGAVDQYGTSLLFVPDHRYGLIFHTTDQDYGRLKKLLLGVKDIDWSMGPVIGPVHHRFHKMVYDILEDLNLAIKVENKTGNYIIELEKALALDVSVPEGTELRPITLKHTEFINDRWPHKNPLSFKVIEDTIRTGGGYGLFNKKSGEMLSWALHSLIGGVGMIKTAEEHRGKGYGTVIARALTKKVASEGATPQVQIRINLDISIKLFTRVGYKFAYHVDWHDIRGTMNP